MAKAIAKPQLKIRLIVARSTKITSPTAKAKPLAKMLPIKGEMSIAPIITAGLLSTSPRVAIPAASST